MTKSIKHNIILDFILSGIQAFFITFLVFILFFGFLHIFLYNTYVNYTNLYNHNASVMIISLLLVLLIFFISFYLMFIRKMNKITDYINEICFNLNKAANGNMDINIPKRRKDELGTLALNVNFMTSSLKEYLNKEREWDKQKINMITNLSHDLRTPLTSILGFLRVMSEEGYDGNDFKHYLNIVLNKSMQLKSSIDQLFEFTKISNYDFKADKNKICLNELLEQTLISFTPEFDKNNMEYRILNEDDKLNIEGDPYLLMRAFENIITNSIKYACSGKYLDIIMKTENSLSIISFVNYGEKIEDEDIKNIFDKYYRSEKTCNKKEGTGLGMTIVKKIMELHDGSIEINSSYEKTEFRLVFNSAKQFSSTI